MSLAIGIDLGTTNSVVAAVVNGVATTLQDENGQRLLPSVVSFTPGGTVLVGQQARARRLLDPENTVFSIKPLLGRGWDSPECKAAMGRFPFKLVEGTKRSIAVEARDVVYALPEISAFVLRRAKAIAERALGEPVDRAVITVPANFNDLQRASTKIAGKLAGLDVMRILNEPTAAALAYGQSIAKAEKIAVYDLGGGTFDVTLLDLTGNVFEVLATAGDSALGGDDIDRLLADMLAGEVLRKLNYDVYSDPLALGRLLMIAEEIKKELSNAPRVDHQLDEIGYGSGGSALAMQATVKREDLEALARPLIERTLTVAKQSMQSAGLQPKDFDRVLLVGGSTRMPMVARMVEQLYGKPPHLKVNPDEVVALGAAIQAHALSRNKPKRKATGRMPLEVPPPAEAEPVTVAAASLAPSPVGLVGGAAGPGAPGAQARPGAPSSPAMPAKPATAKAIPPSAPAIPAAKAAPSSPAIPVMKASDRAIPVLRPSATSKAAAPRPGAKSDAKVPVAPAAPSPAARAEPPGLDLDMREPSTLGNVPEIAELEEVKEDEPPRERTVQLDAPGNINFGRGAPVLSFSQAPPALRTPAKEQELPQAEEPSAVAWELDLERDAEDSKFEPFTRVMPGAPAKPDVIAAAAILPYDPRDPRMGAPPGFVPSQAPPAHQGNVVVSGAAVDRSFGAIVAAAELNPEGLIAPAAQDFARGSAIATSDSSPLLIDVTPLSLRVETVGGYSDVLIAANSPVPCEKTRTFLTASDNQTMVSIRVGQGESTKFAENTFIGVLELAGIAPAPRGRTQILVTFALDADGILNVRAKERETNRETSATMRVSGASTEGSDVAAMLARQQRVSVQ